MRIECIDADESCALLNDLIAREGSIEIVVAWASKGDHADLLFANSAKFRSVTVGLDGFATSPEVVEAMIGLPNTTVASKSGAIFHPKIYYFEQGDRADAILGSSNFTRGGLGRNVEANLYLSGRKDDPAFDAIRNRMAACAEGALPVTAGLAESYRRQHEAKGASDAWSNPVLPWSGPAWDSYSSPLATMEWPEFVRLVRQDRYHSYKGRLSMLRDVQGWFSSVEYFADLPVEQWKAVGGVLGVKAKEKVGLGEHDWGWFGSMGAAGEFSTRIGARNPLLGEALDSIPRLGVVNKAHYETYCALFLKAFAGADRVGGVATASRLLAMKRPDSFVCVNGKNRELLGEALAFSPTTLDLENYWEEVIEPIHASPWYTFSSPEKQDVLLWNYRAAMADAIYYRE